MGPAGPDVAEIHCFVGNQDRGLVGVSESASSAAYLALDAVMCRDYLPLVEVSLMVSLGWFGTRGC
jgi:hypothetical protein